MPEVFLARSIVWSWLPDRHFAPQLDLPTRKWPRWSCLPDPQSTIDLLALVMCPNTSLLLSCSHKSTAYSLRTYRFFRVRREQDKCSSDLRIEKLVYSMCLISNYRCCNRFDGRLGCWNCPWWACPHYRVIRQKSPSYQSPLTRLR